MEKKKVVKNRILAGLLALTLTGGAPKLVKGEVLSSVGNQNGETGIEVSVDDYTLGYNDNYNLDADYIQYLNENGILIVDGNIVIESVDQFIKIKDYYKDYFVENGFDEESYLGLFDCDIDEYLALNMFVVNYNYISDDVKKEILNGELFKITDEFMDICENFFYYNGVYNLKQINSVENNFISYRNIIFNNDLRKIYAIVEEDMISIATNKDINLIEMGDRYLSYLYDDANTYGFNYLSLPDVERLYMVFGMYPIIRKLEDANYVNQYFLNLQLYEAIEPLNEIFGKFESDISSMNKQAKLEIK